MIASWCCWLSYFNQDCDKAEVDDDAKDDALVHAWGDQAGVDDDAKDDALVHAWGDQAGVDNDAKDDASNAEAVRETKFLFCVFYVSTMNGHWKKKNKGIRHQTCTCVAAITPADTCSAINHGVVRWPNCLRRSSNQMLFKWSEQQNVYCFTDCVMQMSWVIRDLRATQKAAIPIGQQKSQKTTQEWMMAQVLSGGGSASRIIICNNIHTCT